MGGVRRPEPVRQLDLLISSNWWSSSFRFHFGIQVLRILEKLIPCEKCGASSFSPCRTLDGQEVAYIHASRSRSHGRLVWERAMKEISKIVCPLCGEEIGPLNSSHYCKSLDKKEEKELPDDLVPYLEVLKEKYGSPEEMRKALLLAR